jgi:hypothetical protein
MQKQTHLVQTSTPATLVSISAAKTYQDTTSFEDDATYYTIDCCCQSTNLEVLMRPT